MGNYQILCIISHIEQLANQTLDFVLAYTQAGIERDLYMKLPAGFTPPDRIIKEQDRKDYVQKRTYIDRKKQAEFGIYI
jgi:hypothetical protein